MKTTLDEWEILHAVVQLGGFAAAAEQLHRSQSTISYAIARLQSQLGIKLFELKGRKAHLTEAGRALLADAEPHLGGFRQLEQWARTLASGGESEVRLSVDSIYPNDRLFSALAEFSSKFPHAQIKLRQATFLSPDAEFSAQKSHLCIAGLPSGEYFIKPVLEIRMAAVARLDHPLNILRRRLTRTDLIRHMMVTIEGISSGIQRRQPRSAAQRYLPVSTIEAAIDAVRSGLCFGWLPLHRIQHWIDAGELRPLALPTGGTREVRLSLVCRDLSPISRELNALTGLLGMNRPLEVI